MTSTVNPFAKQDSRSSGSVITYKVLTVLSWVLSLVVSVYYSFHKDWDGHVHHRTTVWDVNYINYSGFTQNYLITSLYWYVNRIMAAVMQLPNAY